MCLKLYKNILKKIKVSLKRKWKWKFEINRYTTYFSYNEKSLEKVVKYIKKKQAEGICRKSREFHTVLS